MDMPSEASLLPPFPAPSLLPGQMEEGEEDNDNIRAITVVMGGGADSHVTLFPVDPHHQEQEESPSSSKNASTSSDDKFIILVVLVSFLLVLVHQVTPYLRGYQYGPLRDGYTHFAP